MSGSDEDRSYKFHRRKEFGWKKKNSQRDSEATLSARDFSCPVARGSGLQSAEDLSASDRHRSIPLAAREEQPLEPRVVRALRQI